MRTLEFYGEKGKYLSYVIKYLIKYLEDEEVEDFQITEFNKATLVKRGGEKEFIEDNNLNEKYINTLMYVVCAMSSVNFPKVKQVSTMLPLNKFRFTGKMGSGVKSGVEISIRLNHGLYEYKDFGLTELEFNFLVEHICKNNSSVFVIGGTGSGKTSFNNTLIYEIDDNTMIKVVGDIHDFAFRTNQKVSEILAKSNTEYQEAFDLLMRINPDRILIPELSTNNVDLILRAMNSGHSGFMLTMHSDSGELDVAEAFKQNLSLAGKEGIEAEEIQKTINKHIDFLIYLHKSKTGKREISKVTINNDKLLEEAKALGIFDFEKIDESISSNIITENNNGTSIRKLALKYGLSTSKVFRIINSK